MPVSIQDLKYLLERNEIQELSKVLQENEVVGEAIVLSNHIIHNRPHYLCFLGGALIGAFVGFRLGACSQRARRIVQQLDWIKAAAINSYQGVKAIKLERVEMPRLVEETDVLIEVKAASLDPVDIKISQGYGRGLRELMNAYNPNVLSGSFPVILGRDGTGIVREVGSKVENVRPGDRVWFIVPPCFQGSISQFVVLSSEYVSEMPKSLNFESGATLPYTGLVTWSLLVKSGGLGPAPENQGKTVFVWGGVRAVERLCVQLCSIWKCQVTCVAPLYTHDYLRSLGADILIEDDMKLIRKLIQTGQRYDVVINTAGLVAEDICTLLAKPSGRVVTSLSTPSNLPEYGLFTNLAARLINYTMDLLKDNLIGDHRRWFETEYNTEILTYLKQLVDQGSLHPVGERIFSLEQVELAFQCLASGGHRGKLVIRMEPERSLLPLR